mmetsp:Transcript_17869/g.45195  ORF Transcript_17869/g.45195 Transcript_17869/m.45195 type:complete len:242 (-) Transcript_17869:244-969(-)
MHMISARPRVPMPGNSGMTSRMAWLEALPEPLPISSTMSQARMPSRGPSLELPELVASNVKSATTVRFSCRASREGLIRCKCTRPAHGFLLVSTSGCESISCLKRVSRSRSSNVSSSSGPRRAANSVCSKVSGNFSPRPPGEEYSRNFVRRNLAPSRRVASFTECNVATPSVSCPLSCSLPTLQRCAKKSSRSPPSREASMACRRITPNCSSFSISFSSFCSNWIFSWSRPLPPPCFASWN